MSAAGAGAPGVVGRSGWPGGIDPVLQALRAAEGALVRAAGGGPLCGAGCSSPPAGVAAVKRAEGARSSLRAVAKRAAAHPEEARGDVVHGVALTWAADLERWRSRGAADWVAYCEGGLAALDALAAELRGQ